MKPTKAIVPILVATLWIGFNEFIRNNVIFKSYWVDHYANLGLVFPSGTVNGAVWGAWSLALAVVIYVILRRFTVNETVGIAWFMGFFMMWLVIGNLRVLPPQLLLVAVPWSIIEVFGATWIVKRFEKQNEKAPA